MTSPRSRKKAPIIESVQKKLAIFDIDGTIFRHNLHFDLIDELAWLQIIPKNARKKIVEAYASWLENRGTYDQYRKRLVRIYEQEIKGCKQQDIMRAAKDVAKFYRGRVFLYPKKLIEKLRRSGYVLVAISGSPIEIVNEFNKYLKFDYVLGSVYEIDRNGVYTGKPIYEPVQNKGEALSIFISEHGFTLRDSFGMGDTESDVKFLEMVGRAIAFNPNINLERIARRKKWEIVVEKKDVIYNLTDYQVINNKC